MVPGGWKLVISSKSARMPCFSVSEPSTPKTILHFPSEFVCKGQLSSTKASDEENIVAMTDGSVHKQMTHPSEELHRLPRFVDESCEAFEAEGFIQRNDAPTTEIVDALQERVVI